MNLLPEFYEGVLPAEKMVESRRDLTFFSLGSGYSVVIACDSDGGIGNKEQDMVRVDNRLTGYFGTRVPLMEVLSALGRPFLLIDTLSVEMKPAGTEIIAGIKKACTEAGLLRLPITGSTEENIPTVQTGIGVTVLAIVKDDQIPVGSSQEGDLVAVAGIPKSGPRFKVEPEDPEIISLDDLLRLRDISGVHDILPVGSKGVAFEAEELARTAGLHWRRAPGNGLDLQRSGGPSTCVVFSLAGSRALQAVKATINAPVCTVGELYGGGK